MRTFSKNGKVRAIWKNLQRPSSSDALGALHGVILVPSGWLGSLAIVGLTPQFPGRASSESMAVLQYRLSLKIDQKMYIPPQVPKSFIKCRQNTVFWGLAVFL